MTPEQWAWAEEMWLTGTMSDARIAALVGGVANTIAQHALRKGWKRSPEAVVRARERRASATRQAMKPLHVKRRARHLNGITPSSSGLSSHMIDQDFDT